MTLKKTEKQTFSTQRIIKSLENGDYSKIICGAANTSEKQVERLALIYSLCGVDVIDMSPKKEIYTAAKRGITRAAKIAAENPDIYSAFNAPGIMQSLNVGNDKHFRKASFNLNRCNNCLECVKNCQAGALTSKEGKRNFDADKCYGCAICVETCQTEAVSMLKIPHNLNKNTDTQGKYDAVEIHTGNSSIEEVKSYLQFNKNIVGNVQLISVSVDSMRFNKKELIEYVNAITDMFDKKIIIQIDGISMRGGTKNSSTFQTIASAATLLDANVNAYIQLSGGTNHLTRKFVDLANLNISGIGYGTFAKKIVLSYIEEYKEDEFMANLHKIVDIALKLTQK